MAYTEMNLLATSSLASSVVFPSNKLIENRNMVIEKGSNATCSVNALANDDLMSDLGHLWIKTDY